MRLIGVCARSIFEKGKHKTAAKNFTFSLSSSSSPTHHHHRYKRDKRASLLESSSSESSLV